MQLYHDTEWGVPVHQDTKLFEFLVLEGAQAGLSWSTILKRRQDYRRAFDNFDVKRVAKFKLNSVNKLLTSPNTNIVRNRLKIQSAITNARACQIRIKDNFRYAPSAAAHDCLTCKKAVRNVAGTNNTISVVGRFCNEDTLR